MATKNILLLYITEVSGHHSASLAIEKALGLTAQKPAVFNLNAFRYTTPVSEKITNTLYTAVIKRTPRIWDMVYDNPRFKKKIELIKSAIDRMNSPKLARLFEQFKPDVVVCTQAYPCGMVAAYKKRFGSTVPLVGVLTDYVPHAYWVYDNVDYYICPNESVAARLARQNVPPEKIKPLGIPHDPLFSRPVDRTEIFARLGLDRSVPVILIMGGGQGLGPIKTIVASLEKVTRDFQQIIVTGTNRKLYKALKKKLKKSKRKTLLLGYTSNVNELMTAADLIITKPGGITTSEALAKRLPMLIIKPIPGQEANNTVFLTSQKAALKIDRPEKINLTVEDLLTHRQKLQALSEAAGRISRPTAAMDIARFVLDLAA